MTVHVPEQSPAFDEALAPADPDRAPRSRRPVIAGGLAAVWALLVGIALVTCLVMLAWAVSPNSAGDSAAAWRAAGLAWLGAHLVPLQVSGQPVSLLPIGGLLLGLLLTRRAGAWTGRLLPDPSTAEAVGIAVGASLIYGSGGAGIAWLSAGGSAAAEPAWALVVTGAVAAVGTLWGINREADLVGRVRARVTEATWQTARAGMAAVLGLVAVGAALLTASLVRHFGEVAGTLADLDAGFVGAAGLTLVGALSLPNLAIWAMSLLVGPGFDVGSTGGLSLFGGEVESLPALPVLAAIPSTVPGWAPVLMVVPVLLGVLAGRVRWGRDLPTLSGALLAGAGLAGVVAALVAGLGALSAGSFGGGKLSEVGPVLLPVTAAGTGLVLLGFLLEAGFQSARLTWDLYRAEQRATALRQVGDPTAPGRVEGDLAAASQQLLEDGPGDGPDAADGHPAAGPGGMPASTAWDPWSTITGLVAGPGAAVTSRVSGAGASAVRVVTGVGASALAGVGSARTAAVSQAGAVGAAVASAVRIRPEGVPAEETTGEAAAIDLRAADGSAAPGGHAIDLREADPLADASPADLSGGGEDAQPAAETSDQPEDQSDDQPEDQSDDQPEDQSDVQPEDQSDDHADVHQGVPRVYGPDEPDPAQPDPAQPDPAQSVVPSQAGRESPATARADDDTAEIPVIVVAADPAEHAADGPAPLKE